MQVSVSNGAHCRRSVFYISMRLCVIFCVAVTCGAIWYHTQELHLATSGEEQLIENVYNFIVSVGRLGLRQRRSIESVLYYDPSAIVQVHTADTEVQQQTLAALEPLLSAGYDISVFTYSVYDIVNDLIEYYTPFWLETRSLLEFKQQLREYVKYPNFYVHQTGLLRMYLMFKYGGFYLDTDVIVISDRFRYLRNVLGKQGPHEVNDAVLQFSRGHPFMAYSLREYFINYDPDTWAGNGPDLITRLLGQLDDCQALYQQSCEVTVLHASAFQPIPFPEMMEALHGNEFNFTEENYAFHYNNKIVGEAVDRSPLGDLPSGTLLNQLLNSRCVVCKTDSS